MKEKLLDLLNSSYSPYSHFKVASIVVMKDGREFKGVNVENASYGATICAERTAINSAISNGYKRHEFIELHTMCSSDKISMSCFLCRQTISELFDKDVKLFFYNKNGDYKVLTVSELCPNPFDESDLK